MDDIKEIKKSILKTAKGKWHITSSFSSTEILYALYTTINFNHNNVKDILNRDMVIISKEHVRLAQVCVLALLGYIDKSYLDKYIVDDGILGHDIYNIVSDNDIAAIDYASGSLGHGAGVGAGLALANPNRNIYVLIGDGELQEGALWEGFMFAAQRNLTNFIPIIDRNYMQIDGYTKDIINTSGNLEEKMQAFGYKTVTCDGHNIEEIKKAILQKYEKPKCIIANTIKGKGIQYLLDEVGFAMFHHSYLTEEQYNKAYEAIVNE